MKEEEAVKKIMEFVKKEFGSIPRISIDTSYSMTPTHKKKITQPTSYVVGFVDLN